MGIPIPIPRPVIHNYTCCVLVLTDDIVVFVVIDVGGGSGGVADFRFHDDRFDLSDRTSFLVSGQFTGSADIGSDVSCNEETTRLRKRSRYSYTFSIVYRVRQFDRASAFVELRVPTYIAY